MKNHVQILLSIIFVFTAHVFSETVVLQNGLNGYTGCIDASYKEDDPKYKDNSSLLYFVNQC